ncbi:helix-turn-helix domain-containing protein [Rossellomorea aquimaris]|uniref:helix-turn-helix domain-containing protein n=1 Tax=Rossellomorea TaxID=2837508 RepID=UPI001CD6E0DF|nr:helix-turn-helix domain-containing protein [Rossellomorea aquimaris]MCA1058285.1 helix-turn-helix domain-containing protein [Rossellomorea aquimaris]
MTYFNYVILYCFWQIKGERSIYSVFHILNGKKSSQSIQDAHIFHLQPFFLSLPKLKRTYFNQKVRELEKSEYITHGENDVALVTELGSAAVLEYFRGDRFPSDMNGLIYGDQTRLFWMRLSLLVQVLSNGQRQESLYFPVQRNREVQDWVKNCIRTHPDRENLSSILYKELTHILNIQKGDPSLLVNRLTGYKDYGWTELQVAEMLGMNKEEFRFRFLNLLHAMLTEIERDPSVYPLLYSISLRNDHRNNLTISTSKTYDLYKRGHSLEEISRIRKLKQNTIEDHVIELILTQEDFPIEPFITREEYVKVLQVMQEEKTKRLKTIKEKLPQLTYFQIRAAIAKAGETRESTTRA